jgi:hypothetical protein
MTVTLMRLQVPPQWAICYNQFFDVAPVVEDGEQLNDTYFKEDLLWMQSMRSSATPDVPYEVDPGGWLADIGWYPEGEPAGAYSLHLFRLDPAEDAWPAAPPRFRSPNRFLIRSVLEYVLARLHAGEAAEGSPERLLELQRLHDDGRLAEFLFEQGFV